MSGREKTIYDEVNEEGSYSHNWDVEYGEVPHPDDYMDNDTDESEEEES